jgi:glycosyl transferase family 1
VRVGLLLEETGPSGGVGVALGHARALAAGGAEVEVLLTGVSAGRELPDAGVPVRPLAEAKEESYDVAVATWWATAPALFAVGARRRIFFLQSVEQRFYREWELFERIGAAAVLGLPVDFIVVAAWMRDLLAELRPDAGCTLVRPGIDKEVFSGSAREASSGPLRVLVEGHPGLWFKGVPEAVRAVRAMEEPAELTLAALDPSGAEELGADRLVGSLGPSEMAALYVEQDVLVKLSRVESLGLPPLEAFHSGVPCVVTPYTGHEEYVRHGENGLVVDFDDPAAATGWLDRLARDRELLERLGGGALATSAQWPGAEQAGRDFAAALEELLEQPEPAADAGASRLLADLQLGLAMGRHRAALAGWDEAQVAALRSQMTELAGHRDALQARLERITASPPYRVAAAVRRLLGRLRR